ASATATGRTDAAIGGNATVTTTSGDVIVKAWGSNIAQANSGGSSVGLLLSKGGSFAAANDFSTTTARVAGAATVNPGRHLLIGAPGYDTGRAPAQAPPGGVVRHRGP